MTLTPVSASALSLSGSAPAPPPSRANPALYDVARAMDVQFLSEMLKHAGMGEARDAFGGGAGEAQFASLLRDEQARAYVETGGIGLAESIYSALLARAEGETDDPDV